MKLLTDNQPIETIDLDGIVIGVFKNNIFGDAAGRISSALQPFLDLNDFEGKKKTKAVLYNIAGVKSPRVILVGLGEKGKTDAETVRLAASKGVRKLRALGAKKIGIESLNEDGQSTAEGVVLGLYRYDDLKFKDKAKLKTLDEITFVGDNDSWNRGVTLAEGQNKARYLNDTPANICHPSWFVEKAKEYLSGLKNIEIIVREESWAIEQKMGAFMSVAYGSDQPAKFLEIHYKGGNDGDTPLVYIGKGITFDTGGISLKPSAGMGAMKADMSGAGAVVGTLYAIAKLGLKTNVIGITPLTENMPSGKATRPADIVTASNGKTIQVDNTDAEGRMVLADALVYVEKTFKPHTVIDIATLTGAMMVALGNAFIGMFTRSDELWKELEASGTITHDRFWRMPLDDIYRKQLDTPLADLKNVGGREGGSCTAAMFLGEFIEMGRWAHIDIAGNMSAKGKGYHPDGMTGKPVRALTTLAMKFEK